MIPKLVLTFYDPDTMDWVGVDEDGVAYYGSTMDEVLTRWAEEMQRLVKNSQNSGFTIEELREFRAIDRDLSDQRQMELELAHGW